MTPRCPQCQLPMTRTSVEHDFGDWDQYIEGYACHDCDTSWSVVELGLRSEMEYQRPQEDEEDD